MDEILGREVEELNGIQDENMLSTYAEKRLEDGDIGLVPDASDAASQEETDAWSKPEPKEHKISHESRGQRNEPLSFGERDKHFWGTKRAYMKKRMPAALVKQLGHDHENLLENAVVDSETDNILESDPFVVLLANQEIRESHCKYSDDGDEEGEDSSDDELP